MVRTRSLFWTFGGAFLAVLVLWLVLQVVLLLTVVDPLVSQQHRSQMSSLAESCANAIGNLESKGGGSVGDPGGTGTGATTSAQNASDPAWADGPSSTQSPAGAAGPLPAPFPAPTFRQPTDAGPFPGGAPPFGNGALPGVELVPERLLPFHEILLTFQGRSRDHFFLFESADGWTSGLPTGVIPGRIAEFLSARIGRTVPEVEPPIPGRQGRSDLWRERSEREGEGGTKPGRRQRFRSASAQVEGRPDQWVHVVYLERRLDLPREIPRPGFVFIPLATLLSALAGLWLFRGIAGRLRELDAHTSRVASGELEARVRDLGGDEIGALGRALNEMTSRLEESRRKLEETERQRKQFLADVTHDLSTPLTSIRGFAETLLDPAVPVSESEQKQYIGYILEEGRRMDRLVRDLLDLAKLEAGAGNFEPTELDLADLVQRFVERRKVDLARQGIALASEAPTVPLRVNADGGRVEQALGNLIDNAVRYSGDGGLISVRVVSETGWAVIEVDDAGPGFPESELPHVFDRFYRGEKSRPTGGSGLGLSIVREIVHAHGGEVRAENRREGGARVVVRFPSR
ncbi:MAG: ATP-binding protein [Candidatus Eisenbacteria bacterium]